MPCTNTTCKILAGLLAPVAFFLHVTEPVPLGMQGITGSHNEFSSMVTLIALSGVIADEDRFALLCSGIVVGLMAGGINPHQPWQGGLATAAAAAGRSSCYKLV